MLAIGGLGICDRGVVMQPPIGCVFAVALSVGLPPRP